MNNVRIRVVESCGGSLWWYVLFINNRPTTLRSDSLASKQYVISAAKKIAKRIGIPYDPKIVKQHGC